MEKKSFELFQYQNSLHAYMYMDDKFHENNTKYLYNEFEAWFFLVGTKNLVLSISSNNS